MPALYSVKAGRSAFVEPTIEAKGHAPELSIDRLFDAPALAGLTVASLKISPNNSRITFLKGKDSDKDCLDLWEWEVETGNARLLVDSSLLQSSAKTLSDEEMARRERRRMAALSGIVEYAFSPRGDALLFPVAGELFYCRLDATGGQPSIEPLPVAGPVTDPTTSPTGDAIAYIRDQDIFVFELGLARERRLTHDGGGVIKNGMAEFVAQEEMDRSSGYWWSPDGGHVAFTRVDESPVPELLRFEVGADKVTTVPQRYPLAGAANAQVMVGIVEVASGQIAWVDMGADKDIYVARVNWLPDGKTLSVQRQSRDQRRLDLLFTDISTGGSRVVLTETSESWIDLNLELTFLSARAEFIWASSRSGYVHLYLYRMDGSLIRQLTDGNWSVDNFRARAICGVEEVERVVFFLATAKSPLERQLYQVHLDSGEMRQVTKAAGMHDVSMSTSTRFYVDYVQSAHQPPQVGIYGSDGNLITWLIENTLDNSHPSCPYLSTNARVEFGQVTAEDGQTLYYRLMKPHDFDGNRQYPAIVDVYGGPGVQRVQNNWLGSSFSQILTRAGYVVLMLDNRGSAHRGAAFQAPLLGKLGEIEVTDQLAAVRWLMMQSFVDPARIGVWGWSYGGYLTLMLMFKAPEIFCAGISGAPVTDWSLYDTHYTERYLGTPTANPDGYASSAVFPYARNLRGALMIMHGMADDNVILIHSTKLLSQLQNQRSRFEIMLYPGAKHGLLRMSDGRHAYATMLDFFNRTLRTTTKVSKG